MSLFFVFPSAPVLWVDTILQACTTLQHFLLQSHSPSAATAQNLARLPIGSGRRVPRTLVHLALVISVVGLMHTQDIERMRGRILFAEIFRDFHEVGDESIDQL